MIVKKYRLDLGKRNIRDSDGNWITKEEQPTSKCHRFARWSNDVEFFTVGTLINHFEEFFGMGFPAEYNDKIIKVEYNIPEGEFVVTRCFPEYHYNSYRPNRNLFRYCKSVQEVLDCIDAHMETFRVVLGQFKLEKPLTTLYVADPYNYEKRCWKYPGT